jgi:hypothetical protein
MPSVETEVPLTSGAVFHSRQTPVPIQYGSASVPVMALALCLLSHWEGEGNGVHLNQITLFNSF